MFLSYAVYSIINLECKYTFFENHTLSQIYTAKTKNKVSY